jgi:hypothetical protein
MNQPSIAPPVVIGLCLAGIAATPSCAQPLHLQYDFGRAYTQSLQVQANLDRPTAAQSVYPLGGTEALLIRENVIKQDSAEKSGKVEATSE